MAVQFFWNTQLGKLGKGGVLSGISVMRHITPSTASWGGMSAGGMRSASD